jgi:hypothetical protein
MRARDPDELLIEELLRPPPLEQARNSLEFWKRRRAGLRLYRLKARREAKAMVRVARAQVAAAERVRYGSGLAGLVRRLLAGEPLPWWGLGRRRMVLRLAWRVGARGIIDAVAVCVLLIIVVLLGLQVV